MKGTSRDDVANLLVELELWRNLDGRTLSRLWRCPRCGADIGEPCRTPSGDLYRFRGKYGRIACHAPRLDRMIYAHNVGSVHIWREDLIQYGDPPERVFRSIRCLPLYRRLVRTKLLWKRPEWIGMQYDD